MVRLYERQARHDDRSRAVPLLQARRRRGCGPSACRTRRTRRRRSSTLWSVDERDIGAVVPDGAHARGGREVGRARRRARAAAQGAARRTSTRSRQAAPGRRARGAARAARRRAGRARARARDRLRERDVAARARRGCTTWPAAGSRSSAAGRATARALPRRPRSGGAATITSAACTSASSAGATPLSPPTSGRSVDDPLRFGRRCARSIASCAATASGRGCSRCWTSGAHSAHADGARAGAPRARADLRAAPARSRGGGEGVSQGGEASSLFETAVAALTHVPRRAGSRRRSSSFSELLARTQTARRA